MLYIVFLKISNLKERIRTSTLNFVCNLLFKKSTSSNISLPVSTILYWPSSWCNIFEKWTLCASLVRLRLLRNSPHQFPPNQSPQRNGIAKATLYHTCQNYWAKP